MKAKYVFDNTKDLLGYMQYKLPYITQLKLHTGLYCLWGAYAVNSDIPTDIFFDNEEVKDTSNYPVELFKNDFKCSKSYGVYVYEFKDYTNDDIEKIKPINETAILTKMSPMSNITKQEIMGVLNDILGQLAEIRDPQLVKFDKERISWQEADNGQYMNPDLIKEDFYRLFD